MQKIIVIESTRYGKDGISSVVWNYFHYQNQLDMDFVTINEMGEKEKKELEKRSCSNYVFPYRNRNSIRYMYELVKLLRKNKYQIMHVHGCSSTMALEMVAGFLAGVKIRIAHSHNTTCDHVWINRILRPVFRTFCNVRFACSEEAGRWLFGKKRFHIISNGIDVKKYAFQETVRKQKRREMELDDAFVVGHVGRFSEQKNHTRLLDIVVETKKICDNVVLLLVGDGVLFPEIREKAEQLGVRVIFAGECEDVVSWLQAMDVFVLPSLYEGLPVVLMEAQAAGLPCVVSDCVSDKAQVMPDVRFLGLQESNRTWAEQIIETAFMHNRSEKRKNVEKEFARQGCSIHENAAALCRMYKRLAEREKKLDTRKKTVDFVGIRIDNMTREEVLDHVDACIEQRKICHIVGVNVDQALRVIEDRYSAKIFEDAEIVFTDGTPIVWLSRFTDQKICEKIAGPDLMLALCERAAQKNHSIFLLGAGPGVAARAAKKLEKRFPGLKCVGTYSPPFGFEKDEKEIGKINKMLKESGADQLFVGMGSPKQDIFIYENMHNYKIPVSYSMGAAIDFIAGSEKRAPRWMQDCGLEWFYRFLQNPKKMFRRYFVEDRRFFRYYFQYIKKYRNENRRGE